MNLLFFNEEAAKFFFELTLRSEIYLNAVIVPLVVVYVIIGGGYTKNQIVVFFPGYLLAIPINNVITCFTTENLLSKDLRDDRIAGMAQLNEVSPQNAASSEELSSISDMLSNNVKDMHERVDFFKI